jgi:hypothetical protein
MCSWQVTVTYGALLGQFETEHFAAAVLKAQNARIRVHHCGTGTQPCKEIETIQKCHVTVRNFLDSMEQTASSSAGDINHYMIIRMLLYSPTVIRGWEIQTYVHRLFIHVSVVTICINRNYLYILTSQHVSAVVFGHLQVIIYCHTLLLLLFPLH